jgi:GT2 family glycosyltransferase
MSESQRSPAKVTIVAVPRERYSLARRSLESIFAHTREPFELIYVDGNAPRPLASWLKAQAQEKGFQLLRHDEYLPPNRARNIGFEAVRTPYVVFIDNDVIVSDGWLEALVRCAEDTGAAIAGPLTCEGEPIHTHIHFAGGESHIVEVVENGEPRRYMRDTIELQAKPLAEYRPRLQRKTTECFEFHCVLMRTDVVRDIGGFDEDIWNTKENVDFALEVARRGGEVYLEPDSLVTYLDNVPMTWSDMRYYVVRWSDAWTEASLDRIKEKWNLSEDGFFQSRYANMGWRRRRYIIRPFCQKLPLPRGKGTLEMMLSRWDRWLNRKLVPEARRAR